jgi:two-component system, cell cycle sensor histidine kinase and response regulator CckA
MLHMDFERFFELSLDMLCIASVEGYFIRVNASFQRYLGWSAAELTGQAFAEFIHPDDRAATAQEIAKLALGAPSRGFENRYRCADGSYRVIQWMTARDDASGMLYAIGRDIADVVASQAKLQAAKEAEKELLRKEAAIAASLNGIAIADLDGRLTYVNRSFLNLWGYADGHLVLGRSALAFWESPEAAQAVIDALQTVGVWSGELTAVRAEGVELTFQVNASLFSDAAGAPMGMVASFRDITERKKFEEALRLKDQAIVTSLNAVVITDGEGVIVYVNPSFVRLWGYASETEVLGRGALDFAEPEATLQLLEQLRAQGSWQGELLARRKDGTSFNALISANTVCDASGNISNLVGSVLDISDAKRLQAQFLQAQKMESVGRLAGGVAHDFNNLLTVMKGYLELATLGITQADPLYYDLSQVNKAVDSASSLTQQLLAFSRQQIIAPQLINLNEVIGRVQKMLHRLIGEDVELRMLLADNLASVRFDPGQSEQVIINLAVNARDAMFHGGKLTIETAMVQLDEEYARYHAEVQAGSYVMLAVSDTGSGMSEQVQSHLFEPFFTTKELGKGTGLGLAMVYGAVSQNGGRIEVYSELGQGTTFKIYLPQAQGSSVEISPEQSGALPRGNQAIILVEDDENVRVLAARLLGQQGYRVYAFRNGMEAISAVSALREELHLLITDVIMPEMNGRVLAERIRALRPTIKILFTSGYTANVIVHHGVLKEGIEFLPKPYSIRSLAQRVHEVLATSVG